ncbi:uncharacterized protein EI90DRAFT_3282897 [Cantharellus anzutake]|uniref:uncharacterized protein n=1 Tax=Cantharellus anzutake TaxID=1750568 RepID=UPI0019085B8E|nr:uncharacterized protein EI90DRAFT_3282897 [Cantharellus anzutake]KAF8312733.1 hypothetical protein EI90DRAFT_3282897 [Cantharellus anzutake]
MSTAFRPVVKRTYGRSAVTTRAIPSSPRSEYSSDPLEALLSPPKKRKRDASQTNAITQPPAKKPKTQTNPSSTRYNPNSNVATKKIPKLKQLHLTLAQTSVRQCNSCGLSYTHGAPEDEDLHRKYCVRVSKGSEWGREESRAEGKEAEVIEKDIPLKNNKMRGRVVAFRADASGKLGSKLSIILQTVNFTLSAPDLTPDVLSQSKAYLFLVPTPGAHPLREKIVGCLIAQRIETAMEVVDPERLCSLTNEQSSAKNTPFSRSGINLDSLVCVQDSTDGSQSGGLFCLPNPVPTPLGIPRIFTASSYRHQGIAQHLLNAATRTSIHGCVLDPSKGQVAFSQPTGAGRGLMEKWGGGMVRIYQE